MIETAAVIGTGMMGPGIAASLALGGIKTLLVSRTEANAKHGLEKALAALKQLADNGLIAREEFAAAQSRLQATSHLENAARQADLIIESIPEDLKLKQQFFKQLDDLAPANSIVASNTSGISITSISEHCSHPERVLTTHFWYPAHLMPLVELVKGKFTGDQVIQQVKSTLEQCGKVPVVVKKDRPGQLGNRLQMAMWREAMYMVQEGIADVEDIDLAVKNGFGLRLPVYGIFEHIDTVGLELAAQVVDYVSRDLCSEPGAPEIVRRYLREGRLGIKSGKGFYDWSKRDPDEVAARRNRFLISFLKSEFAPVKRSLKNNEG